MKMKVPSLSLRRSCGLPLVGVRAQAAGHSHTKDPPERDPAGLRKTRIETPVLPELLPPPSRLYKNLMREGKHPLLASAAASFLNSERAPWQIVLPSHPPAHSGPAADTGGTQCSGRCFKAIRISPAIVP
ncbi:hypothetical protein MHYP_G00014560 [Metynnis hypsauchen]